jgi:hypothetical protein
MRVELSMHASEVPISKLCWISTFSKRLMILLDMQQGKFSANLIRIEHEPEKRHCRRPLWREEFVIILPNTKLDVAHKIMDGIRRLVSETFATEAGSHHDQYRGRGSLFDNSIDLDAVQRTHRRADACCTEPKEPGEIGCVQ